MATPNPPGVSRAKTDSKSVQLFHKIAVLTVLAGAAGSLGFTLFAGRHNESVVLIVLFAGWVVAPFITLLLVNAVANRWSRAKRLALYSLMLLITVGSLAFYSGLWSIPDAKPAFVFLIVPLLSWFILGVALLTAASLPNKS